MAHERAFAPAIPSEEDVEKPLGEIEDREVKQAWSDRYGILIANDLHPSDALLARVYREMRRFTMTLIPLNRMKSLVHTQVPAASRKETLAGNVSLHYEPDRVLALNSVVDMYWALRTWANAVALAGNFEIAYEGKSGVCAPLALFLDYADEALRKSLRQPQGLQVQWLERTDTATRGRMIQLVRAPMKMPLGVALKPAITELQYQWNSLPQQNVISLGELGVGMREVCPGQSNVGDSDASAQPLHGSDERDMGSRGGQKRVRESDRDGRRHRAGNDSRGDGRRPGAAKGDSFRTVTFLKGGQKLCKAFNDGRGCPGESTCGTKHLCDAIKANGKPCGEKHPRTRHDRRDTLPR